MFDQLFEKLKQTNFITEKLSVLHESKTWEQIALALYGILNDTNEVNSVSKEDASTYCDDMKKLLVKRNECVCHIYGMSDTELLAFYKNMGTAYYDDSRDRQIPTYEKDKAEVEAELEKRGLTIPELTTESKVNENLTDYARKELQLAGLFDKDSDYNGMLGEAVLALIEKFAEQGHSGCSATLTTELFNKLARFQPLTELTDDINEWMEVGEDGLGTCWQSRRSPVCFSHDSGKTYYDLDEMDKEKKDFTNRTMHNSKHIDVKDVV